MDKEDSIFLLFDLLKENAVNFSINSNSFFILKKIKNQYSVIRCQRQIINNKKYTISHSELMSLDKAKELYYKYSISNTPQSFPIPSHA